MMQSRATQASFYAHANIFRRAQLARGEGGKEMEKDKIKRHGKTILLGDGITATEGMEGNLPSLRIRKNGKQIRYYRGSSLRFSHTLSSEDKDYLISLAD